MIDLTELEHDTISELINIGIGRLPRRFRKWSINRLN